MGPMWMILVLSVIVSCGDARTIRRKKRSGVSFSYNLCVNTAILKGPPNWNLVASGCGSSSNGNPQSPINIDLDDVSYGHTYSMAYDDTTLSVQGSVKNNGHTVAFSASGTTGSSSGLKILKDVPELSGKDYVFGEWHFHIGADTDDSCRDYVSSGSGTYPGGSEHSIDDVHNVGEMHLVHWLKEDSSSTFANSAGIANGLVALGIMFEVSSDSNKLNSAADDLIKNHVKNVKEPTSSAITGVSFNPYDILPSSNDFFTYKGTTTTPICRDTIRFVIFKNPIYISPASYEILQKTKTEHDGEIKSYGNRRPIQDGNSSSGSAVKANFNEDRR